MSDTFQSTVTPAQEKTITDMCAALGYAHVIVIGINMDYSQCQGLHRNMNQWSVLAALELEKARVLGEMMRPPAQQLKLVPPGSDKK